MPLKIVKNGLESNLTLPCLSLHTVSCQMDIDKRMSADELEEYFKSIPRLDYNVDSCQNCKTEIVVPWK